MTRSAHALEASQDWGSGKYRNAPASAIARISDARNPVRATRSATLIPCADSRTSKGTRAAGVVSRTPRRASAVCFGRIDPAEVDGGPLAGVGAFDRRAVNLQAANARAFPGGIELDFVL